MARIEIRALQPIPKTVIAFAIVWNLVLGTILVAAIVGQRAYAILPFFFIPLLGMLFLVVRRRRWLAAYRAESTNLLPTSPTTHVVSGHPDGRWVGSGSFPGWFGMTQASYGLAIVEVFGDVVRVRLRPKFLGLMFGTGPLVANAAELEEVFLVYRLITEGIGFRPVGGPTYYLWTSRSIEVLAMLEAAHFPVTREGRKRDRWWWVVDKYPKSATTK